MRPVRFVVAPGALLACSAVDARDRALTVRLTPFDVPPGRDRIPCEYLELPNATAMDVQRFEVRTPRAALHHILLYAYLGDDRDPRHLTNALREGDGCTGLGPPDMARHSVGLLGAVRGATYAMPADYAVSLQPRQPVWVQMHAFGG